MIEMKLSSERASFVISCGDCVFVKSQFRNWSGVQAIDSDIARIGVMGRV